MKIFLIHCETPDGEQVVGIAPTIELACETVLENHKSNGLDYWFTMNFINNDYVLTF